MSVLKSILSKIGYGDDTSENSESTAQISNTDNGSSETSDPNNFFAPEDAVWYKDNVVLNGNHARTYAADSWPTNPQGGLFSQVLLNSELDYDFALHYHPYDASTAVDKLDSIEQDLNDKRTGDFARFVPDKAALEETEKVVQVMKKYINQGQSMLDVSFFITIYAEDEGELEDFHKQVRNNIVTSGGVSLTRNTLRQKAALQSCSPIGKNVLGNKNDNLKQKMLGSGAAKTFPFLEDTFMESNGVMFGVNEQSDTPVIIDIFDRSNGYNVLVSGMIGAGKSFSTSQILLSMDAAYRDFQQYIVDPMGDFQGVNHALDGERIVINGDVSINPMAIKETPEEVIERADGKINPWTQKKQELKWFFTQFFEITGSNEESLSNEELATLDTAITKTYHKKGITEDIETHSKENPTISDLIETIQEMAKNAEEEADTGLEKEVEKRESIAVRLLVLMDPFKPGNQYHNLAQETEIDVTGERTVYLDLQQIPNNSDDMGVMMKLLMMRIYQEAKQVDNKVSFTIDEAHKIMRDDGLTAGLEEMFRHSRHFDLSIQLLSQTPEEFYQTQTAKTIAKQCSIKKFHYVDSIDEDIARGVLDMNDAEIDYIESAEPGKGDKNYSQALLRVGDEDTSLPLRIYATKDEQIVIDYDPAEENEYDDPQSEQLVEALDVKSKNQKLRVAGDEESLSTQVRSSIAKKQQNRERLIESQQVTDDDADSESPNDDTGSTDPTQDRKHTLAEGADPSTDSDTNNDPYAKLRGRVSSEEAVDGLSDSVIRTISSNYGIGTDEDDINEIRDELKTELFGSTTESVRETPVNQSPEDTGTNTDKPAPQADTDDDVVRDGKSEATSEIPTEPDPVENQHNETATQTGIDSDQLPDSEEQQSGPLNIDDLSESKIDELYLQYIGDIGETTVDERRTALQDTLSPQPSDD
jgi:hypothetical protein